MSINLETRDLVKKYAKRTVVNGVNIEVKKGEIVGLLGPNGAGKSTTFHMMVGSIEPSEGKIFYGGDDITYLPMYKRARLGIGYLPQESSIFRKLTVEQNIESVLEVVGMSKVERLEHRDRLMEELGITHLAKSKAYTLSGGERRRAEIARALATDPSFILLDEPFSGIDPIAVQEIKKLISNHLRGRGLGILITDHNATELMNIVERAYLIADGNIMLSGSPKELIENPIARDNYFGNHFELKN